MNIKLSENYSEIAHLLFSGFFFLTVVLEAKSLSLCALSQMHYPVALEVLATN
jgi:hypothetical protein